MIFFVHFSHSKLKFLFHFIFFAKKAGVFREFFLFIFLIFFVFSPSP